MDVIEAEARLVEILEIEGFNDFNIDPIKSWSAFKKFVKEPVECDNDGILVYIGCNDGECVFSCIRQFSINDSDHYDRLEQLHLELISNLSEDLLDIDKHLWSYDFKTIDKYFEKIESFKEFDKVMSHKFSRYEIYQEVV